MKKSMELHLLSDLASIQARGPGVYCWRMRQIISKTSVKKSCKFMYS